METIFEMAARNKFRFQHKGQLTVEDLWDLPVRELDAVFKTLNKQLKQSEEESLLATKSADDKILEAKIAIVKHIVAVKIAEEEQRKNAAAVAAQKQKVLGIISEKEDAALHDMSLEDLKKMVAEM